MTPEETNAALKAAARKLARIELISEVGEAENSDETVKRIWAEEKKDRVKGAKNRLRKLLRNELIALPS